MKKLSKIFIVFAVFSFVTVSLFAGGAKDSAKSKKCPKPAFELTKEEKAQGWRYFQPIGFKLHRPAFFDKYKDNADSTPEGEEKRDEVLYAAYEYGFISDELIQKYYSIVQNKELTREQKIEKINSEINAKILPVYALVTLNTKLIDKDLKEITGFPINEVIRKTKEFTQILAIAEFSPEGLSEKSAAIYKEMISEVMPIKETITCVDPISYKAPLTYINNFEFEAIDLNGKPVTSDIFKDYDVTMVNVWATFCGYCIRELPDLEKLHQNFKDKKCNVIGVVADVSPDKQDKLDRAKQLFNKAKCTYTCVQKNDSFEPIIKHARNLGIPLTLFLDKNGNVIASDIDDIIVGSRDLETFTKAMEKALKAVQK